MTIYRLIFVSRGILLFCWLCLCPIFRMYAKKAITSRLQLLFAKKKNRGEKIGDNDMEEDSRKQEFGELLDQYQNTNSFLYSSLNMEIVCTILKGINVVLREINLEDNRKQKGLQPFDFKEIKIAKLKTIQVLNRAFFE